MSITLEHLGATVVLPDGMQWQDELAWAAVEQGVERTITGALVVQAAARIAGRPYTLQSLDEMSGWISRASLHTLRAWAEVPGLQMVLSIPGQAAVDVIFRHHEAPVIDAKPVMTFDDLQDGDFYTAALRLMGV